MTPDETKYWADNNDEQANLEYAIANNQMTAKDAGLAKPKETEAEKKDGK